MEKKRLLHFLIFLLLPSLLAAQEIRTGPTEEELMKAQEMLRGFQGPKEKEAEDIISKFQRPDEEKAKEFLQVHEDSNPGQTAQGRLFYFFSFSMPRGSLKTVVSEAEKTGAVMVLRGVKEDTGLRGTMLKIAGLINRGGKETYPVEVWIHPVLFRCFHVDAVPEIVYVTGDQEGCSQYYIKVRGDVSLEYTLSLIAKEDSGANILLELLKENFYK